MTIEVRAPDPAGPPPDYCCAVLVDADGAFLLERRPTTKSHAPGRLTCFGGRREPGEEPDVCILRELTEELGATPAVGPPELALHVDGALIAWFYVGDGDLEPTLESGVELVRLPPGRLDHPDLSTWHRPVLETWISRRTGSART